MNFRTSSAARSVRVMLNPVAGACWSMLVMRCSSRTGWWTLLYWLQT
jgi:hypothetical protein